MEDGLILGYDLCEEYSRISCYRTGELEPIDVEFVKKGNPCVMKTVICKKRGADEWLIGQEAYMAALNGEGIMVDKLLRLAIKNGTATIEGTCYTAEQLLTIYLQMTLNYVFELYGQKTVRMIVMTMQTMDEVLLDMLDRCLQKLGVAKEAIHMLSHSECFAYFVLSQKKNMWSNLSALFDLTHEGLHYYEMGMSRNVHPMLVKVNHESLEEGFSLDILEQPSGKKLADSIMLSCAKRLLGKKTISGIYLSGMGMDHCQDWADDFLSYICGRRKVYYSQNLFAKGAVYAAVDHLQKGNTYPFVFVCEGRIPASVSMEVVERGTKKNLLIAPAGSSWYEARAVMDLIPDRSDKLVMRIVKIGERTGRKISIGLESFPPRPNKTTRLRVFVRFLSEEVMQVRIEDKGFGEFFPASDVVIEREFNLVKEAPPFNADKA
ncbi:MAG: DUF5716 family protein [Candidatus Fimimorpha sp.]